MLIYLYSYKCSYITPFFHKHLQECLWKNSDYFIVCLMTGHKIRVLEQLAPTLKFIFLAQILVDCFLSKFAGILSDGNDVCSIIAPFFLLASLFSAHINRFHYIPMLTNHNEAWRYANLNGSNKARVDSSDMSQSFSPADPPTITESKSNVSATGRPVSLKCAASAVPTPDFEWYRDDTR